MFTLIPPLSRGQAALRGALATILGIVFVIWPGITIGTAVVLFAFYCIADSVMQFTDVFSEGERGGQRALGVVLALLDLAAAAIAIAYPGPTATVLVLIIGIWAIVSGFAELAAAFRFSSGVLGVTSVLSIAAGIVLVAWPGIGAVTLAVVVGFYLALYGVVLLVAAAKAPAHRRVGDPLGAR
jgi:uncharacterized membrane protein HdeD (DUF308 family)